MRLETASRAMRRMWLAVKDGEGDARGDAAEALCGLRRARFLDIDHDDLHGFPLFRIVLLLNGNLCPVAETLSHFYETRELQKCIRTHLMSSRSRYVNQAAQRVDAETFFQDIKGNWKKLGSGSFGNVYKGESCFIARRMWLTVSQARTSESMSRSRRYCHPPNTTLRSILNANGD